MLSLKETADTAFQRSLNFGSFERRCVALRTSATFPDWTAATFCCSNQLLRFLEKARHSRVSNALDYLNAH